MIRSLEVLGEASKRIPEEIRKRHPGIPWREMAGMRDKLIHEYHGVDIRIVWNTVREEIPALLPSIEEVLNEEKTKEQETEC